MKKNKKKVEVATVEHLNIETKKTAAKLVNDPKVSPAEAAAAIINAEQSKTAEPALTLPAMTAEFCIQDPKYWEGKDDIYNKTSNECSACAKDYPDQPAICAARTAYLASIGVGSKKKTSVGKTPKVRVPKDGRLPQSAQIDVYINEQKSIADMTATLAERDFNNDLKPSRARIISHLKAILSGRYCKSADMKPKIAYLSDEDAKAIGLTVAVAAA